MDQMCSYNCDSIRPLCNSCNLYIFNFCLFYFHILIFMNFNMWLNVLKTGDDFSKFRRQSYNRSANIRKNFYLWVKPSGEFYEWKSPMMRVERMGKPSGKLCQWENSLEVTLVCKMSFYSCVGRWHLLLCDSFDSTCLVYVSMATSV